MKRQLAVSFGKVTDWKRRHPSEGVSGHLVALGKETSEVRGARVLGRKYSPAFLCRLSFRPGPVGAIGLSRLARGIELGPMVPTVT